MHCLDCLCNLQTAFHPLVPSSMDTCLLLYYFGLWHLLILTHVQLFFVIYHVIHWHLKMDSLCTKNIFMCLYFRKIDFTYFLHLCTLQDLFFTLFLYLIIKCFVQISLCSTYTHTHIHAFYLLLSTLTHQYWALNFYIWSWNVILFCFSSIVFNCLYTCTFVYSLLLPVFFYAYCAFVHDKYSDRRVTEAGVNCTVIMWEIVSSWLTRLKYLDIGSPSFFIPSCWYNSLFSLTWEINHQLLWTYQSL